MSLFSTGRLKDIMPGANGSEVSELTAFNGSLYFAADDGVHGRELWKTDGSVDGTQMVEDLVPGPESSSPKYLAATDTALYYFANDGGDDLSLRKLSSGTTPFDQWLDRWSIFANTDRSPSADPNSNGIPNSVEFALDTNPLGSNGALHLSNPVAAFSADNVILEFSYVRRRDFANRGLRYAIQTSEDLQAWQETAHQEFAVSLDAEREMVRVQVISPSTSVPHRFSRLMAIFDH